MKAIIVREFGPPEVMKLGDTETPQPSGTEVLVRVHAVGVNPVETYIRSGSYARVPALPYTPGNDAAGVVESVGENVTKWKPGDRVYTTVSVTGTYAEFTLCDQNDLGRLPDSIDFERGAGIWTPYATAFRALFQKAKAKSGENVLIHGASGGVGIAAIQWLTGGRASLLAGNKLTVFGTASSDEGKQLVRDQGADHVLDHTEDSHFAEIVELTGGRGVDLIIEMLANVNLQRDFEALAMFGRICVVGNRGSLDFNPRVIMGKDATVTGMALYNSSYAERDEIHAALFDGLSKRFLNPIVSRRLPLAEAARAHHEIISEKGNGKIVLLP